MPVKRSLGTACAVLLSLSAAPAGAAPTVVKPCARGTADARRALEQLTAISDKIAALSPSASPEPLAAELRALAETKCFELLPPTEHELNFDSSLSLREFWKHGGESFFDQVLRFDEPGNGGRHAWTSPTPRKSLTLDSTPKHPLGLTMLCHERDPLCGKETEPWQRRANSFMSLFDRARSLELGKGAENSPRDTCAAAARKKKPNDRFDAFRSCAAEHSTQYRTMLPLGRFRAPRDGWLVVRGRRGHYSFCDEVRAYDLATGSAYVAKSCSGLALLPSGMVDGAKTNAGRQQTIEVGRLSLDAIREAAWMIALSSEAQTRVVEHGVGWHVPTDIEIVQSEAQSFSIGGFRFSSSSGQTSLEWSWIRDGARAAGGSLRWPEDYDDAAREHAVRLLDIAEAGWIDGCAPVPAPTLPQLGAPPHVSPLDARASTVASTQSSLLSELSRIGASRVCSTPPPRPVR